MPAPRTLTTERLRVRPPAEADRDLWVRVHTDPAQYPFAPWWRARDADAADVTWRRALAHWAEHGFGYGVVEDRATGEAVGVAGAIHGREGRHLNLYYRLDVPRHGYGLGPEVARAVVADVLEHGPDLPLTATARPDHASSIRTAERSGLALVGAAAPGARLPGVPPEVVARSLANDPPDVPPSVVLLAPRVQVWRSPFDATTRERVLDLWCATNDAGGAVGFLPGGPAVRGLRGARRPRGAAGVGVRHGGAPPLAGRRPRRDGPLGGRPNPLFAHGRTAYRVMTDPDRRGRNLGRLVMAAMHRVAREDGVEVVQLVVRSGLGLSRFYERSGYREVGRVPGTIRVAPGDDRDSVVLARRLDGRPMEPDGRP